MVFMLTRAHSFAPARTCQTWESTEIQHAMDGMRSFCKRTGLHPSEALFLDIGSNLGTFSMAMAALGYRAIAFEAMPINQKAIKHSACANNFQSHLHVIESGVGRDQVDCQIYVVSNNAQNGIVSCNDVAPLAGCVKVDDIKVNTLDNLLGDSLRLLRGKVGVVKIDVEGFEPWVIDGGRKFFSSASPAYIVTEINSGTLSKISNYTGMEYIRKIESLGYLPSLEGFDGTIASNKDLLEHFRELQARDGYVLTSVYFRKA